MNQPIDPINPYTGEVSVKALMQNIADGHDAFPPNMGQTIEHPCHDCCPPKLTINSDGKLSGWDELDQWGRMNHPRWSEVIHSARCIGLSEIDRIKLLASVMLSINVNLMDKFIAYTAMNPAPPTE